MDFCSSWYPLLLSSFLSSEVVLEENPADQTDPHKRWSTCESVWPGHACTCVDLPRPAFTLGEIMSMQVWPPNANQSDRRGTWEETCASAWP